MTNAGHESPAPEPSAPRTSPELAQARTDLAHERNALAEDRDRLALVRTRLAYDRTLMAWVRTSASLISFGFTIYKFFDALGQSDVARPPRGLMGPREFALVMIALGVGALLLATLEHRRELQGLRRQFGEYGAIPRSLAGLLAGLVSGLGTLGLVLVFLRQ